ncbi:MAG: hypothetical protein V3W18_08280 [candidate division Zixibacteria bacterium]
MMNLKNVDNKRIQKRGDSRHYPFAGLWQNFACCNSWDLSEKTVNVSADPSEFEKIIWPKTIKS